ncbi:MAG: hypothetical protein WCG87_00880 [Bacteroidota bacterium]
MNSFEKAIIDGMKTTIRDYISFKGPDHENEWSKPEYLATLNIAKSITRFNSYPAEKIIIAIEENTSSFSNACVPQNFTDIYNNEFKSFNTDRNGKIDIAVYETYKKKPICTIEVKNFNPQDSVLILDLQRNAQYFTFQAKHNISIIQKTYVAYFKHYSDTHTIDGMQNDLTKAKNDLDQIIQKAKIDTSYLSIRIEAETIHENLLYSEKYSAEEIINDTGDFYANAVHFIGVLGIFERKLSI